MSPQQREQQAPLEIVKPVPCHVGLGRYERAPIVPMMNAMTKSRAKAC